MRKICFLVLVLAVILMVGISYAQSPRQPTSSEGKTTFTNIAVTGLDATNVPGYIEMMSADGSTRYYLYVDSNGNLRIASEIAVGRPNASPSTVSWENSRYWGQVGPLVSSQLP